MDNYLTTLYRAYFDAVDYEKKLQNTHPEEQNKNVRNDQSITEAYKTAEVLRGLIIHYLATNYDSKF